jgi:hypothetical protein
MYFKNYTGGDCSLIVERWTSNSMVAGSSPVGLTFSPAKLIAFINKPFLNNFFYILRINCDRTLCKPFYF